jgi:hypothetical protein
MCQGDPRLQYPLLHPNRVSAKTNGMKPSAPSFEAANAPDGAGP